MINTVETLRKTNPEAVVFKFEGPKYDGPSYKELCKMAKKGDRPVFVTDDFKTNLFEYLKKAGIKYNIHRNEIKVADIIIMSNKIISRVQYDGFVDRPTANKKTKYLYQMELSNITVNKLKELINK